MKNIPYIQTIPLCICLLICSINSHSEEQLERITRTITIPLAEKNMHANMTLPARGDSANKVENEFGTPLKKHAAKGKPPISKWEYAEFTVYFESNYVIHNVVKNTSDKETPE